MKRYRAKITKENFRAFADYYNADRQRVKTMLEQVGKIFYTHNNPVREKANEMFDCHFMANSNYKETFRMESSCNQTLFILVKYIADHDLSWNVVEMQEDFLYLCFSGNYMFWTKQFCTLIELADYEALSMAEVRGQITGAVSSLLPAEMNALSVAGVREKKDVLHSEEEKLKKLKEDINYARTEELKKMEQEIEKLQDNLRERKKCLLEELGKKTAALQAEMDVLNKQIYMMESEIYVIRSYSGETVELSKVRSGNKADRETPLVVNQKLLYLDEDLARIVSIYQEEIANRFSLFADAVAGSDEVFETFCPQERCLTFFRLSKNASYLWYNEKRHMYEMEELIHGKKIGFLLRDGACAYIGWLDESWRLDKNGKPVPVTFTEDLMYQPQTVTEYQVKENGLDEEICDSRNSMLSRVFAMSVVQGILDNKGLLEFAEKVNVTKPGKYIVYNFAAGWIMDDRFGDFATLVANLNKRTKVKDQILVCCNKSSGLEGRGEADRTYDCELHEGLNRINFLESDDYGRCDVYVSAKKRWSEKGATANIRCHPNEYINITYMNSIWLMYYIQTKKLGKYCEDYAKMIKHFKRAVEIIQEREAEEMAHVKKYYPRAENIPEWQILLSHWKLNNHIRFINDFQAKRIAKYLEAGKYEENAHLFESEKFYKHTATAGGKYEYTVFSYINKIGWEEKLSLDGFTNDSAYHYENFYLNDYDTRVCYMDEDIKKQKEHNAAVIAKDMPKLEALVPERIKKDEEKLALVNDYVMGFMSEHGVSVSDLTDESEQTNLIFNKEKNNITFRPVDELTTEERTAFFDKAKEKYPIYILQSECWKVAYNDFVQRQYNIVLHDVKIILHRRFMDDRK